MNSTAGSRLYETTLGGASEALQHRYHYLDNLRALAMIAGVFFHAALAYSPMLHNFWLSADSQQSFVVDVVGFFMHIFRMPLFFLIAGFFAAYLVSTRGMGGFMKNRAKRVLLPFIIFLPLCLWAVVTATLSAAGNVESKSPVLAIIAHAMANPANAPPPPPPTTMHLWFLYILVFLYALTWVFSHINWSGSREKFIEIKPFLFLLCFPLLLMPGLLLVGSPLPAPDSFLPQLWAFGFFGLFFVVGYWVFKNESWLEKFSDYWVLLLIGSVLLYSLYYHLLPKQIVIPPSPLEWKLKIALKLCEAFIAVWMAMVCLVVGKRFLNGASRSMRFMADSSYWIYLVHVPLLFSIQYQLMDVDWSWFAKFSVSITVTLAVGVVSYLLLVRWTPIGWMLNGRK